MRTNLKAAIAAAAAALAFAGGAFAQQAQKPTPGAAPEAEQHKHKHKHGERGMSGMRGRHERMGERHGGQRQDGHGCGGMQGEQQGEHSHS